MYDYWSQLALKGLHIQLMKALKSIDSDPIVHILNLFEDINSNNSRFWSIDLTSATDRFPRYFQKQVLSILLGKSYTEANVLVGSKFLGR